MTTETRHTGFFAIPAQHLDEIGALYDAWGHAVDELQEDSGLYSNRLYDRASEVAAYQVSLAGRERRSAKAELAQLFYMQLWKRRKRKVFSPEECAHYRAALAELIEGMGGEAGLVRRLTRDGKERDFTAEHVRDVYRAVVQVLGVAVERGLGFTWAARNDDAEAELAEQRRAREERFAAHEEQWRDKRQQQGGKRHRDGKPPWRPERGHLFAIDDATADNAIAHLLLAAMLLDNPDPSQDPDELRRESDRLDDKARAVVTEHALLRTEIDTADEARVVHTLDYLLRKLAFDVDDDELLSLSEYTAKLRDQPETTAPPAIPRFSVYNAQQAARMFTTLCGWAQLLGDLDALLDHLVTWERDVERDVVQSALQAYMGLLLQAERNGLGLAWMEVSP